MVLIAFWLVCGAMSAVAVRERTTSRADPHAWIWSRVAAAGVPPAAREGHAAIEVGNRVYVIGGCVQEIRCFNDVHIFDTESLSWSQEPITGDPPEPRGGHSATLVGTDIFVFGGASSEATFDNAYKLDLINRHWTRTAISGSTAGPCRRTNHAAAADSHGRIYIFGGYDADGDFLNDMWILSVYAATSGAWHDQYTVPITWEKPVPTGQVPSPRESHSLTLVGRKLVLFGGYTSGSRVVNDVHVYNLDAQEWLQVPVAGEPPSARQAHSAVRHGDDVVIAGGCSVSEVSPVCYNDVWSLNTIEMRWARRSTDLISWFPREGHTATFIRGQMFVFGGCQLSSECYSDVAVLDTSDPCPAGCGGHGACMVEGFCQCSAGFTGHDCMQPLSCPQDCSDHGVCSAGGTCACENGWSGTDCATELPCPNAGPAGQKCGGHGSCSADGACHCFAGYTGLDCMEGHAVCPQDCSGHGTCSSTSQCVCHPGWTGAGCSTPVEMSQAQNQSSHKKANVSLLLRNAGTGISMSAEKRTHLSLDRHEVRPKSVGDVPEGKDFGVQSINEYGHIGASTSDCPDNCNFRGVCEDGECYCQPGFHGSDCGMVQESKKGTVNLLIAGIVAGATLGVAFTFASICLMLSWQSKRAKEKELGYIF